MNSLICEPEKILRPVLDTMFWQVHEPNMALPKEYHTREVWLAPNYWTISRVLLYKIVQGKFSIVWISALKYNKIVSFEL